MILLIAFVVVGPRDLPKVGTWLGRVIRRCSKMLGELRHEMGLDDLEREVMQTKHGLEKNLRDIGDEGVDLSGLSKDLNELSRDINKHTEAK